MKKRVALLISLCMLVSMFAGIVPAGAEGESALYGTVVASGSNASIETAAFFQEAVEADQDAGISAAPAHYKELKNGASIIYRGIGEEGRTASGLDLYMQHAVQQEDKGLFTIDAYKLDESNGETLIGKWISSSFDSGEGFQKFYLPFDEDQTGVFDLKLVIGEEVETTVSFVHFSAISLYDAASTFDGAARLTAAGDNIYAGPSVAPETDAIQWFGDLDYVIFPNVVFGETAYSAIAVNMFNNNTTSFAGASAEVRLDGPGGKKIGELTVEDFQAVEAQSGTEKNFIIPFTEEVAGTQNICLIVKGLNGPGRLQTLKFIRTFDAYSPIRFSEADVSSIDAVLNDATEGDFVGWFDNGNYVTYEQINFGETGSKHMSINLIRHGATEADDVDTNYIKVYLDDANGTEIAKIDAHDTLYGGSKYQSYVVELSETLTGVHSICIVSSAIQCSVSTFRFYDVNEFAVKDAATTLHVGLADDLNLVDGWDRDEGTDSRSVVYFYGGSTVTYFNVDFGQTPKITVKVQAGHLGSSEGATGTLEIRKDNKNGDLIASFNASDMASNTWGLLETALETPLTGVHTLCVVSNIGGPTSVPSFHYMTFEGEKINGFTAEAEVIDDGDWVVPKAYVTMHDNVDPADSVTAICAFYDADGRLITHTISGTLSASNMTKGVAATLEMAAVTKDNWTNAASVRVFVWDSFNGMKPQVPAMDITKEF